MHNSKRVISFSPPDIRDNEINEVVQALQSGWITTGKRTKEFERLLSEYIGTKKAVALNSATAAMELTLRILGVGPGDEVITSAYTYTATAAVIHHVGAKIVLVDTMADSYEMDYNQLENAISERTKVIIPVDIAGCMCDYKKIFKIVEDKKELFRSHSQLQEKYQRIIVMADSAHGFGAKRIIDKQSYNSGQIADFTCFSFHAVKNLTTAEGGAAVWKSSSNIDDEWLYKQYMLLSLHGQTKDAFSKEQLGAWEYDIMCLGYKCNMTDTLAVIGIKQLERYDDILLRRKSIIMKYNEAFVPYGLVPIMHYTDENQSSGHLYMLRIPNIVEQKRNDIINIMAKKGITTNVHYKPLPMMTAYKNLGFCIENYPNAYHQYENEISLPLHTCLSDEDVEYIIEQFINTLNEVHINDISRVE